MTPKRFWREMKTTEFDGDTSGWIAVLPVAAIEQHGPHLPVGVDAIIAEEMVARAAKVLDPGLPVTFLPVQEICKSNEHVRFAGTLTINWRTVISAWLDIGASLARAGIRKVVLITSHGGNVSPMEIVSRELRERHDFVCVTTSWAKLGQADAIYDRGPVVTDIHGGLSETSVMLAMRPDLVDMEKARDFGSAQTQMKADNDQLGWHSSNANIAWLAGDLNEDGVVGDAVAATAELGDREIVSMIDGFAKLMAEVAATNPPGMDG